MDDKTVKRVEPKPEVNIFLRKPFVADDKREQRSNDEGFQQMLDDSIAELKKEGKSFSDAVDKIYEEALDTKVSLTPRQIQIMELERARARLQTMSMVNEMEQEIHLKH